MSATLTWLAGLADHELAGDASAPTIVLIHANGDSAGCRPGAAHR